MKLPLVMIQSIAVTMHYIAYVVKF